MGTSCSEAFIMLVTWTLAGTVKIMSMVGRLCQYSPVRSNQTVHQDFCIREGNGLKRAIQLEDTNIPLRPGQRVTLVCALRRDRERGWMCSLVNRATGQTHESTSPKVLQQRLCMVRITGILFILALVAATLVVYLTMPSSLYFEHP